LEQTDRLLGKRDIYSALTIGGGQLRAGRLPQKDRNLLSVSATISSRVTIKLSSRLLESRSSDAVQPKKELSEVGHDEGYVFPGINEEKELKRTSYATDRSKNGIVC